MSENISVTTEWMVAIRPKTNNALSEQRTLVLSVEEVVAIDDVEASWKALKKFQSRCEYDEKIKSYLAILGISSADCCAPRAVAII